MIRSRFFVTTIFKMLILMGNEIFGVCFLIFSFDYIYVLILYIKNEIY